MRIALVPAAVFVAIAASSQSAAAQTPASAPAHANQSASSRFVLKPVTRDLFSQLFLPAQKPAAPTGDLPVWTERPVVMMTTKAPVACGMTLMAGDAKVDPVMPHPAPERAAQAAIRTIPAPPCVK
jgi:hypothetical protein